MNRSSLSARPPLVVAMAFLLAATLLPSVAVSGARALGGGSGAVSLTTLGSAYTQDFDTLANTGTTNNLTINGWYLNETGTSGNNNGQYQAGTGSTNAGDVYSFGAAASTERALGGLLSGTLNPTIGAQFTNNTGSSVTSLDVSYIGEMWRAGVTNRNAADRLDFQLSANATSLTTGTWVDYNSLDVNSPNTNATAGALNGNAAGNRTPLSFSITGLSIANGGSFWIRWLDSDIASSDDGLAVDDFSLTPLAEVAPSVASTSPANGATNVPLTSNVSVTFSEPVNVAGTWFDLTCATSGAHTATVSGGPSSFTLDPNADFVNSETCTLTVYAAQVSDQDAYDPPDLMAADHVTTFTAIDPDTAPTVSSTVPANGATDLPINANLTVTFSEPVNVTASWFTLSCTVSGTVATTSSGGPTTFTLDPGVTLIDGETCTLTVLANQVSDQDGNDPPDNMVANYVVGFSPFDVCAATYTPIYTIQGSGLSTPIPGVVTTKGVVVGDYEYTGSGSTSAVLRGFYIQDANGDADPATSDGIFVFNGNNNSVSLGDVVRVTGTAAEFQDQTQISASAITACATGSVAATDVTFPAPSSTFLEQYEGMLVRLPQTMYVTEHFQLGRFGQVVLSSGARLQQPTNVVAPGPPAIALQAQNDLNRIILDDASQAQNPDPILFARGGNPLSAANTLRGGDTVTNIVGVMTYTWAGNAASGNAYRVRPINTLGGSVPNFQPTNARPASAPPVGGTVKVVGMNLLNYFNTFADGNAATPGCFPSGTDADCRGANSATEFARQYTKTVPAILAMNPDVLGFNEIENDGYGPTSALQSLVDQLNVATAPGTYAFIDVDANTGQLNALGNDAIKVGMIYKPATVTPVGQTAVLNSVAFVNGGDGAPRNRPSLAQAFQENATGARFIADLNHLKSKGSACDAPDLGDGQGNCNQVRVNAVTELLAWLATDPTGTGDPDILLIGDHNSYAMEDPIAVIRNAGFTNLVAAFGGLGAYSYVFDGQWGYLDQALGSASIVSRVTGVGEYHIDADEPSVLDYNVEFKSAGQVASLYAPDQFRISDHDPVVVGLDLGLDTTTSLTVEPTSQQYSDRVDLVATISPTEATGSVQFQKSTDNGVTFSDIGSPVAVVGGVAPLDDVQILDAAGTPVRFKALFKGTNDYAYSNDIESLTVTREDASILYAGGNPVAAQVSAPGSPSWAGPLSLSIGVKEREPDVAGTGAAGIGAVVNAGLSVELVPLGSGGGITLNCVAGSVAGTGYAATRPFTCTSPGAIPLGTFEVVANVTGAYYTGTYSDAFTVYDPSLGFATGGGRFTHDGDPTTFGFVMKYTKKGTNLQGSFIAVRHHADGTVSRLKSNSLGGLAILDSSGCGTATFNGKATYMAWDPAANGGLGAYVTTGNNPFAVRADDCNNPGNGDDAIWVGGPGDIGMMSPASTHLATLTGGNIAVPHKPAR